MQYSTAEMAKAEQLHRSGLEINEIKRKLVLRVNGATLDELSDFTERYNAVLQKYSINHDRLDFLQHQLERPEEYQWLGGWSKLYIILRIGINRYTSNTILLIETILIVGAVLYGAFPFIFAHAG